MKYLSKVSLALVLIASVAILGCAKKTDEAAAKSPDKVTTLSFWTFQELHSSFMLDAAESWNKLHPDEKVELKVDVLPYDEMHNKLLISLQSGTSYNFV